MTQTTKNLPESCKTAGHHFRQKRHWLDYKKGVVVRCSRCGALEKPPVRNVR